MKNKQKFTEWAKDKMFYSTHSDYIEDFMIMGDTIRYGNMKLPNGVIVRHDDAYQIKLNEQIPTRIRKQLEGWCYKQDYLSNKNKYINRDEWNCIPEEYQNIKIKQ